jgi:L-ribulose-5-phosphate 4-epimerase
MLDRLKEQVCRANLRLAAEGLVFRTFGNVSGVDRHSGHLVIKASGVPYEGMEPSQMVAVSLQSGRPAEGPLRPSSDTPAHLELYRAFEGIGGVAHTHSVAATAWAQARGDLPALGTTHADYFCGPVPCTRVMTPEEIREDYEANTGKVIVERLAGRDALEVPAALVANHGPFAWGRTPDEAVLHAVILEHVAGMAIRTRQIEPYPAPIGRALLEKHFRRKHGPGAYYGQPGAEA